MPRYESRYCTFSVPEDWQPQPPFGYAEPGEEDELMAAQAIEQWLESPTTAQDLAAAEKETLPQLLDGFEWIAEGPASLPGSPGDAFSLEFRNLNEDREGVLVKKIFLTEGPLCVELSISRPEDGDRVERARLAERIASTFRLRDTEFLSRHQPLGLFASDETSTSPSDTGPSATPALPVIVPDDAPRKDFPRCCVSVPEIDGWALEDHQGAARYLSGHFTIQLDRPIGEDNDAEAWQQDLMARLQSSKTPLLASGRGELEVSGAPWSAMLHESKAERRWNTEGTPRSLGVYVEDRQPLMWRLSGPRAGFDAQVPTLEALLLAVEFLEPARWETPVAEPWIDSVLTGPWTCEGPGLYFEPERAIVLQTMTEESQVPLANIRPSIVDSVKSHVDIEREFTEDALDGKLQGAPSLRYSLDGENHHGEPVSLRTLWSTRDNTLHGVVALTRDPQTAQESFENLTRSIRFQEARR